MAILPIGLSAAACVAGLIALFVAWRRPRPVFVDCFCAELGMEKCRVTEDGKYEQRPFWRQIADGQREDNYKRVVAENDAAQAWRHVGGLEDEHDDEREGLYEVIESLQNELGKDEWTITSSGDQSLEITLQPTRWHTLHWDVTRASL